jgi:D-arabinose 1-dehydrogenase-like Zn-dependent alcohol dehydrogenase
MSSSDIPSSCPAVVIEKVGAPWTIKEVPVSAPKSGEVLIKVLACGVCHSDSFLQQGHLGEHVFPRVPGHEVIGKVIAVGDGEKKWKVGDRVGGGWHGAHDGSCKACNKGLFQMCENELVNGVSRDGGYAEYCTLRSEAAVRIPADANPAEYAPLLCAGVTVFNGIRKMNIQQGDTIAVQGLGGLGHLAVQYARKMGYRTVAVSSSDNKKDFAFQLGATDYIDTSKESASEALQKMGGASLIVVTAPNPKIIGPLVEGLGPLGKLLVLAPVGDIPVNTVSLITKGKSVHGWPSGHALDSEEAIDFAEKQGVKCMIEKFPFDKVEDAVQHMESGKVRFRSVIVME